MFRPLWIENLRVILRSIPQHYLPQEKAYGNLRRQRIGPPIDGMPQKRAVRCSVSENPPQPAHWPVGYIQGDPNHTRAEIEHPTPVRDRLRAAVADPNTSEQDRQAARETLRISFHE